MQARRGVAAMLLFRLLRQALMMRLPASDEFYTSGELSATKKATGAALLYLKWPASYDFVSRGRWVIYARRCRPPQYLLEMPMNADITQAPPHRRQQSPRFEIGALAIGRKSSSDHRSLAPSRLAAAQTCRPTDAAHEATFRRFEMRLDVGPARRQQLSLVSRGHAHFAPWRRRDTPH